MARIFPFKGIFYNSKKIKKLAKVMTPPYDVISPEQQEEYYKSSNFNFIRLILGKEFPGDTDTNNKYVRASSYFEGWRRHDILVQDEKPQIYIYEQRFSIKGKKYVRIGFLALLRFEDGIKGKVYPHEKTLSAPKLDRIELIRATKANFDSIFSLYSDEKGKVMKVIKKFIRRKPIIEVKDEFGTVHKVYKVDTKPAINKIINEMSDHSIFIADGHHRFEAAMKYRNEMKDRNARFTEDDLFNHVMMYFTPIEDPGLLIFPIHRLVKPLPDFDLHRFEEELGSYFDIKYFPFSKRNEMDVRKKLLKELEKNSDKHCYAMAAHNSSHYYLLTLKNLELIEPYLEEGRSEDYKHLDVTILHSIVMNKILNITEQDQINYAKDVDEVISKINSDAYQLAFLLNPTKVSDVLKIAGKGEKLPQKSTFFYPKLISGLIMNKIEFGEKINGEKES